MINKRVWRKYKIGKLCKIDAQLTQNGSSRGKNIDNTGTILSHRDTPKFQ